jgi:hypothetical protein
MPAQAATQVQDAQVAAEICGLNVGPVAALCRAVDRSGARHSPLDGGEVFSLTANCGLEPCAYTSVASSTAEKSESKRQR